MRRVVKRVVSYFLVPVTRWHLRKERSYRWHGILVTVMPGVFHPGLFHSTKFLLTFLSGEKLSGLSFLELGCGSGLISVWAARQGALVTASDLNPEAVRNATVNAQKNGVRLTAIHSDLFDTIPGQGFQWIVINPPYYRGKAADAAGLAWKAGEHFEYFEKLFSTVGGHLLAGSKCIMVLTLESELGAIVAIAARHHFEFVLLREQKSFLDGKDMIYEVKSVT